MSPKVSIVIPLYNKAAHIAGTLESVFAQTEQNFEIIVIDDGSTDGGGELVAKNTDARIKLIRQNNSGVSGARNRGVQAAVSDLICFLDADDEYRPEFLSVILRLRQKYPAAGLYATAYAVKYPDGKTRKTKYRALPAFPWEGIIPDYFESALGPQPVFTSACAADKKALLETGGFPVGEKLGEDLDTWFRLALKYPVAFSNYEGAVYKTDAVNRACNQLAGIPDFRLVDTARAAIRDGQVPLSSLNAVQAIIDMRMIISFAYAVKCGDMVRARACLKQMQTNVFLKEKIFMQIAVALPYPLLKILLRIKDFLGFYF